ncbi:MAG TPA: hypothetical protein VMR95_02235 [Candidatus Binatia bacterium]|jgi:hypothetical protein|nr:hypothetical protein [Candidatus Binatia bacterium]
MQKILKSVKSHTFVSLVVLTLGFSLFVTKTAIASNLSNLPGASPNPQSGAVGLEGTITTPPPSTPPTISLPTNGQSFSSQPVTISGICVGGLLIRVFSNGVFIGAAQCSSGSYSISVSLFDGQNQLTSVAYDALGQSSPVSSEITVSFNPPATTTTPQLLLTSAYAERGASPGTTLSWPIDLSGGTPPYAISIDWGDTSTPDLISQAADGTFTAEHSYNKAGVYNVLIKVTDQTGAIAYLQLVGVGNGKILAANSATTPTTSTNHTEILWWPAALAIPLIILAFWLGGRHKLMVLRRKMEKSSERMGSES